MRKQFTAIVKGYAGESHYWFYANNKKTAIIVAKRMYENQWYLGPNSVYSVEVF